ncbi:MAG TPA: hypothetical protein VNZ44_20895 [Pyrinomonadaceae bacterium]|nr:hypothetical protein [Pyrinomonadaceae bacterium]
MHPRHNLSPAPAGDFTGFNGYPRSHIARLNPDGSLDPDFNAGTDGLIRSIVVQPGGYIAVGGSFATVNSLAENGWADHPNFVRFFPDGTPQTMFDLGGANGTVNVIKQQADGRLLLGGEFTQAAYRPRNYIARLNLDGSLDAGFDAGVLGPVYSIALQADGRIVLGGRFSQVGGQPRSYLARLNADGTLDSSFNPLPPPAYVSSVAAQADGRILVAGPMNRPSGSYYYVSLVRLNQDGTLDAAFPAAIGSAYNLPPAVILLQADGRVLVGGKDFAVYPQSVNQSGHYQSCLARVLNTEAATQSLSVDPSGGVITWQRGGTAPEVNTVSFEYSTDGFNFATLGTGTRVPGGWRLSGLALPRNQPPYVRARGFYPASGAGYESSPYVETVRVVSIPGGAGGASSSE